MPDTTVSANEPGHSEDSLRGLGGGLALAIVVAVYYYAFDSIRVSAVFVALATHISYKAVWLQRRRLSDCAITVVLWTIAAIYCFRAGFVGTAFACVVFVVIALKDAVGQGRSIALE